MNLKLRIIYTTLLILFSITKSYSQVRLGKGYDDFIFIKDIPKPEEIIMKDLSIHLYQSSKLNKVLFLKVLDKNPKAIKNSDEILVKYHYSNWADIIFSTSEGKYKIQLYLGGLGFVTLPNGKTGAVLFDVSDKKP